MKGSTQMNGRNSHSRARYRAIAHVCAAAALLASAPGAAAQNAHPDAGTFSMTLLNGGLGPVGTGLSEGLTAWAGSADAIYWNPAAATRIGDFGERQLTLSGARLFGDMRQTAIGYAAPWYDAGVAFQILYFGLNDIPVRGVVPTAEPLGSTSAYDLVASVSMGFPVINGGGVGITLKGLYEKLDVSDAAGLAFDIGIQAPLSFWSERLTAGFAVRNLGSMGELDQETLTLPWSVAGGLALTEPISWGTWYFRGGVDYWKPADDWAQVRLGIEAARDLLRLRAGYRYGRGWNTFSAGLGLAMRGWQLDYAYVFDPDLNRRALGNVQRLGVSLDLGGG
jgi:hypothetical protein